MIIFLFFNILHLCAVSIKDVGVHGVLKISINFNLTIFVFLLYHKLTVLPEIYTSSLGNLPNIYFFHSCFRYTLWVSNIPIYLPSLCSVKFCLILFQENDIHILFPFIFKSSPMIRCYKFFFSRQPTIDTNQCFHKFPLHMWINYPTML